MVASRGKFRLKRCVLAALALIVAVCAALFFYGLSNLNPIMLSMAQARAQQLAVEAINNAVGEVIGSVGYEDLVNVVCDEQGRVTMIQANTLLMNELASRASLAAQRNLTQLEDEGVELPLGSALGIAIFAGSGPNIRVSVVPVGSVTTGFVTTFESAGINQTRHEISLEASTLMHIIIPTGADEVVVNAYVPVAESIIVGQVPESYVNVPDTDAMMNMIP